MILHCVKHSIDSIRFSKENRVHFEIFHEQLPLPVPCYDLPPVTELTLGRDKRRLRVFPAPLG